MSLTPRAKVMPSTAPQTAFLPRQPELHPWHPVSSISMEDRIVIDPALCNGRPVLAGTRITVQTVLEFLGAGDSIEDVLEEYPTLTRDDVLACLRYSSLLMGNHFTLQKVA
jgi:uncharacterized protein (DUF433 family)